MRSLGKTTSRTTSGRSTSLRWSFGAHPAELGDGPRRAELYVDLPPQGVGRNTGLAIVNLGYANDPAGPYFRKLRRFLAKRYDCACACVAYMGTAIKSGRRIELELPQPSLLLDRLSPSERRALPDQVEVSTVLDRLRGSNLQGIVFGREHIPGLGPNAYFDYGPAQAMDIVWAAIEVREALGTDPRRTWLFGSSLAGYLALLAVKLAPRTFAGVVEVSAPARIPRGRYFRGGRAPFLLDSHNTSATLLCDNYYVDRPGHPRAFTPAMAALRDLDGPGQVPPSATALRSIHGSEDAVVSAGEKLRMVSRWREAGRDAELLQVGPADVDGRVIRHAGHSLGANFHALITRLADPWCDPHGPRRLLGDSRWDRGETLRFPAPGGTQVVDHRADRPIVHLEPGR